jgi:hypothetical protein
MRDKTPQKRPSPWVVPQPTRDELLAMKRDFIRAGTQFLKVDLATGLTCANAALSSRDGESRRRNQNSARKAYDTVVRMLKRICVSDADAQHLQDNLQQLRTHLIQLGEVF